MSDDSGSSSTDDHSWELGKTEQGSIEGRSGRRITTEVEASILPIQTRSNAVRWSRITHSAAGYDPRDPAVSRRKRRKAHRPKWVRNLCRMFVDDEFVAFRSSVHPGIAVLFAIVAALDIVLIYPLIARRAVPPITATLLAIGLGLVAADLCRNIAARLKCVRERKGRLAGHMLAVVTLYMLAYNLVRRLSESGVCWRGLPDKNVAKMYCLKSIPYPAFAFIIAPHVLPVQFVHIVLVYIVHAVSDYFFYGSGLYPPETDLATAIARMIFYTMVCLQQLQLQWRKEMFDRSRLEAAQSLVAQIRELQRDNARIAALMRSLDPTESFHNLLTRRTHRDASPLCTVVVLSVAKYSTWVLQRRPKASAELLDVAVTFFDVERAAAGLEKVFVRGDAYGASLGLRPNAIARVSQHHPFAALKFAKQVCSLLQGTAALVFTCGIGSGQCSGEVLGHPRLSYIATGPALRAAWTLAQMGLVNVPLLSSSTVELCSPRELVLEVVATGVWKYDDALPPAPRSPTDALSPNGHLSCNTETSFISSATGASTSVPTTSTNSANSLLDGASVAEDRPSLPMAVVDLPSLSSLEGSAAQARTPATALYEEVLELRKRKQRPTWVCCERRHPSYAAAAARHTKIHRNLVLVNLCTLNIWMFAAAALSEVLRPLSIFFFAICVVVQLLQFGVAYLKSLGPVDLARLDLGLVFLQLVLLAAQLSTSGPCVVNGRWCYLLFAGGFAVIPALAAAHWLVGGTLVTVAGGVLTALNADAPAPQTQLIGAVAFVVCVFVAAHAQESDLRASWLNAVQSEAVMAVANEEKQLHQELLRALLPEYIVPHVQAKREQASWTCVAETLHDVAMAHIRLAPGIEMEGLVAFSRRLGDLIASSPALGLVSLDGDQAVIAGPLQSPRTDHAALADSVFYTRSQHRLTEERYANGSAIALLELLRALYEPLPQGVATTALHRCDGLAVVLGVEEPRFSVLGPVYTVAAALANAAPDGAVVMTDSFYDRLEANEWPSGMEASAAATWRIQAIGCVRVRHATLPRGSQ